METEVRLRKLTQEEREALPASDFAVPGKRKLPIHDRQHAELAWKMVDRTENLTPEERAEAKRRILRRLKEFGVDVSGYNTSSVLSAGAADAYLSSAGEGQSRVRLDLGGFDRPDRYGVTLIRAGNTLHGWRFPSPVLMRSRARFDGAASFVDHVPFGLPSVERLVGVISAVEWDETSQSLTGRLRLSRTPAAQWVEAMIDQIIDDRDRSLPVPNVGLSADLLCAYHTEGRLRVCDEIRNVHSVDVVFDPASGGSFDRVLNSVKGGVVMPENIDIQEGQRQGGADPAVRQNSGQAPPPTEPGQSSAGLRAGGGGQRVANLGGGGDGRPVAPDDGLPQDALRSEAPDPQAAAEQAQRVLLSQCDALLQSKLIWCDLPQPIKDAVRAQFCGRVFTPEALDAELDRYRAMLAGMLEEGVVVGLGEGRPDDPRRAHVFGVTDSMERIQLALERLMGLPIPQQHSDLPRLSGIRELYLMLTGDHDFYGQFYPERVRLANVTTTSMSSVVKNVLNKVLLQAYNVRPRWWDPICWHEDFSTLNQITWMKTGGFGNLPTVSEGAAYTELDFSDAEETADFVKKGGYIGITLEMMDRDDVGSVKRIPRELGNAAWRTLSSLVSAIFTDNSGTGPVMSCTHNVFDASNHGNLLTSALSAAQWDAVIQAVYQQTEPTSGSVLAIRPKFLLVPIELEKTALEIVGQPWATADYKHYLDPRYQSGQVIVVPEWTDANDWAAACDPNDCPGICIGYRYGRQPELFVADEGTVGSMFTNDEMRIKVRFFVAVGVADYRPLHKSNVA